MVWIKTCNENMLANGELLEFDYNDKKILVTKIQDKIFQFFIINIWLIPYLFF